MCGDAVDKKSSRVRGDAANTSSGKICSNAVKQSLRRRVGKKRQANFAAGKVCGDAAGKKSGKVCGRAVVCVAVGKQ